MKLQDNRTRAQLGDPSADAPDQDDHEYPMTVQEAARFLGVSPQSVYLWVERKQIPHLRVMGRNIRFLSWWMRYNDREGERRFESTSTEDWDEAQKKLRQRLEARDQNVLHIVRKGEHLAFNEWADFFLENFSRPPFRAKKSHEANVTALKHLQPVFGVCKLSEVTADQIDDYLRWRLRQPKRVRLGSGFRELGPLKATTVHQEFRVLHRILNVAVKKRLISANPCAAVEFPVMIRGLFRPHFMPWSEQQQIEFHAPPYLRNVVRIITETGFACTRSWRRCGRIRWIWRMPWSLFLIPRRRMASRRFP
jgi:excisionase family DNA binding protein